MRFDFSSSSNSMDGEYLGIGNIQNSNVGYYMHREGTLVAIYAKALSSGGNPTKEFELRDGDDGDANLYTFQLSSYEFVNSDMNVDVNIGTLLKCWCSAVGGVSREPIVQVEVAWRWDG